FPAWVLHGSAAIALLMWLYLTLVIGLRWYISGTGPYVGRYNVMMLMAWFSTLAILLLYRRFPLIEPLGFLLAGFTMLLASRESVSPQIMPLMPVLRSPLLSIHVVSMMMSYTLFGLVAFNGIMGLAVPSREAKESLKDVSLVVLYPAVFLLTFGTFLGAVWANISWGSYWAWDPKETWALITMLVYAFTLHGGALRPFRNPNFFHGYTIFAFVCVLVTYFGVNLLLGGMHSYM
ncbi:MAG: cytochrome c biogenesis protein CcsA, partial [Bacteroidales bacterium]|nr:cytochrome c biogenesis protein CcsA [Bacteroidales bacterium]